MAGFGVDRGSGSSSGGTDAVISESVIDAKGDLIAGTAADTAARLAAGANETRLVADSAQTEGLKYVADTTNYAIAAKGDLLAGSAADTVAPLTVGANETRLVADSAQATGLKYVADTTNYAIDAKGDLLVGTAANTAAALTVGTDGQILTADSSAAEGVAWKASEFTTGDAKLTFKVVADSGWVLADDGSIGDAGSGATNRANADTEDLFTLLWNNVSDTYAPVSSGRGASAAADFAAGKTLTIPAALGRAIAVAGAGATLTSRSLGEKTGAETHTLTAAEMPSHTHTVGPLGNALGSGNVPSGNSVSGTTTTSSAGSDGAHNNMQPTVFLNVMIKL